MYVCRSTHINYTPHYRALHQFYAFAALQNRLLEFDSDYYIFSFPLKKKKKNLFSLFSPAALCLKHSLLLLFLPSSCPDPCVSASTLSKKLARSIVPAVPAS